MTAAAPGPAASSAVRVAASPQAAVVLLVAAAAWAATIPRALDMGTDGGTMGLTVAAFVGMWLLMMAAMMLPAVAPLAATYVRTFPSSPWRRTAMLVAGYLGVWTAAGVPLFVLARLVDAIRDDASGEALWVRLVAAAVFAVAGVWQLTGIKDRCLRHCRSPVALLLHYGNMKGRAVDVRVGVHHGAWCLGCCWALMVLFVAVGVMNLLAMVVLAALVYAEKRISAGERLAKVAGVVLLVLAVAVVFVPEVAPGLTGGERPMETMNGM